MRSAHNAQCLIRQFDSSMISLLCFFAFLNLDRTRAPLRAFPSYSKVPGSSGATKGEDHPTYASTLTIRTHILVELSNKGRPLPIGTVDTTCPVRVEQARGKRANARAPTGWWQDVRSGRPGSRKGPVQPGGRVESTGAYRRHFLFPRNCRTA